MPKYSDFIVWCCNKKKCKNYTNKQVIRDDAIKYLPGCKKTGKVITSVSQAKKNCVCFSLNDGKE